jgi:hypothetical protein
MSKANVEKAIRFTPSRFSAKRFKRETFSISFDRSTFCAYKFRVIFSFAGPFQEKDPKGLRFNHSMFRRLLIHA